MCFLESPAEGPGGRGPREVGTGSCATPASQEEGKILLMKAGEVLGSSPVCGSGVSSDTWGVMWSIALLHTPQEKSLF